MQIWGELIELPPCDMYRRLHCSACGHSWGWQLYSQDERKYRQYVRDLNKAEIGRVET